MRWAVCEEDPLGNGHWSTEERRGNDQDHYWFLHLTFLSFAL